MPRYDRVHVDGHLDDAGIVAALRHLEPGKPFRSAYQYQNMMYLVAGLVLKRVSGERCEDFVRARILPPLGMARAATSLGEMLARHEDCAMPHAVVDRERRRIQVRPINTRPSGGICAAAEDFCQLFHRNHGLP